MAALAPLSAPGAGVLSAKSKAEINLLFQQAYAAYGAADYPRALAYLDQAEAIRPDQPDALNLRGIICLKTGAYDQAETAFSRAVALDPDLWAAQFNLGEVPLRKKDYARARARFERLAAHTDRFKQKNQWELVQYKAFLCCVLAGDEAAAQKKLEKLPAAGGVTPAYFYAQTALAFAHKDQAGVSKWLAAAQSGYNDSLNSLFAGSLVNAGWMSQAPAPALAGALAAAGAGRTRPGGVGGGGGGIGVYADPRTMDANADALPMQDGGALVPPAAVFRASVPPPADASRPGAPRVSTGEKPPASAVLPTPKAPTPGRAMSGLDNGGLLTRD